ncbi:MAG TPA: Ig-like domain-containing protein, partial [Thermoanaerobaculia bacterium]
PNVTQTGMILVRGWAFHTVHSISKVELYVDDQFQHVAPRVYPRIDAVEAYPNYPALHTQTPGFVTGFSSTRFSNGPHTVEMRILTSDGVTHFLGRRTINIDNTINQAPFGFVDQPDLRGTHNVAGSFPVVGWAADTDGILRVEVQIDDANMQAAMYGDPRPDVGNTYPDFPGALFSGFIANVDTTRVLDGVHTLTVTATDNRGMTRVIGRRTVQIFNSPDNLKPFGRIDEPLRDAVLYGSQCGTPPLISPPVRPRAHITPVRGWALDLGARLDTGRVSYVELLVDGSRWLSTDNCGFMFGGFANCYGLPRYDVQRYYPNYPDAPLAGFMFTLDVGALLASGVPQGRHVLKVRVGDQDGTFAELPNRDGIPVFFQCGETVNFAAEGFIDIPTQFDYIGGTVTFHGWALDANGVAAVEIIIDGNYVGQAQYGFPRTDVAIQNPQLTGAENSGWRFTFDTRKLANARHRLTVRVVDQVGRPSEIGSVDFYTNNLGPVP